MMKKSEIKKGEYGECEQLIEIKTRKRKKEDEEIRSKIMREIQRMRNIYRQRKRKESRKKKKKKANRQEE